MVCMPHLGSNGKRLNFYERNETFALNCTFHWGSLQPPHVTALRDLISGAAVTSPSQHSPSDVLVLGRMGGKSGEVGG